MQVGWYEVVVVSSDVEEVHCWLYDSLQAWRIQCRERQVRSIEQWYVHESDSGKQVLHILMYNVTVVLCQTENHIQSQGSQ